MAITGLLERLKQGLAKTAQLFALSARWFGRKVDQSFLDDSGKPVDSGGRGGKGGDHRIIDRVREAYIEKTADEHLIEFVKSETKAALGGPSAGGALRRPPSRQLFT